MNMIKKTMISALLALSALGLTTSLSAFADGASDAAVYCVGCHDGLTVIGGVTVGGGARSCPQRTATEWETAINRMNGKGCGVPAGSIAGIASYLAGLIGDPFGYDMGIIITSSSTYLLPNALDSYGVSYSATITNYGPSAGIADINLQIDPTRVWTLSITPNCVRSGPGCRATLAAGEQATVTASSYVRLDSNLSLNLSLADVVGDSRFEENSANNSASISFTPPVPPPTSRTCYDQSGNPFTVSGWCPLGSTANPPPTCAIGTSPYLGYVGGGVWSWSCVATTTSSTTTSTSTTVATTTTTTIPGGGTCDAIGCLGPLEYCTGCHDGLTVNGNVFFGGAKICSQRTVPEWEATINRMNGKGCGVPPNMVANIANYLASLPPIATSTSSSSTTSSTTSTTATTVATTTTTTLCNNTYVNGTTQYPYSGSGSCHGHPDNDSSSGHVVRDQKWCRKHMTHFNSSGNHTHAYPHPACM